MTQLTAHQMRRLALVRHLFEIGVQQSRGLEPTSALALLPLHDAVEMYLQLLCEHHRVGANKPDFMRYFDLLKDAGVDLTDREPMRRLNAARVNIKHQGVLPAAVEVEGFRAATTNFLHNNSRTGLGIEFDRISLTNVIADVEIRGMLEGAEQAIVEGDHEKALAEATTAFVMLISERRRPKTSDGRDSYSLQRAALRGLGWFDGLHLADELGGKAASSARKLADAVRGTARAHSEAIMVLGLGLDFTKYTIFKTYAPIAQPTADGSVSIQWMKEPTDDPDAVRTCVAFVVDAAVRLGSTKWV